MKKHVFSLSTLLLSTLCLQAGGEYLLATPNSNPLEAEAEQPSQMMPSFIENINGYLRVGYQLNDKDRADLALGGKLHFDTVQWHGLSVGASFYTTNQIHQNEGAEVPFFDANQKSYSLLGESYLRGTWGATQLTIGRQELDTPFADSDDIGMVPNTFEAYLLTNTSFTDTTITLGQIQKMAGVDATDPAHFEKLNNSDNVQTLGIAYASKSGLSLSSWYYNLTDATIESIAYVDGSFEGEVSGFSYLLGLQYAQEAYSQSSDDASIYGVNLEMGYAGVGFHVAYNQSNDNTADNGFGGGPFFTSAEFLTLAEGGKDAEALLLGGSFDTSVIGIPHVTLTLNSLTLTDENSVDSDELDLGITYEKRDFNIQLIYSDVEDTINNQSFENTRIFMNYLF